MGYQKDDKGNVIDPPVLPEFEQRITAAANTGSNEAVAAVQADYDKARKDLIAKQEKQDSKDDDKSGEGNGNKRRNR